MTAGILLAVGVVALAFGEGMRRRWDSPEPRSVTDWTRYYGYPFALAIVAFCVAWAAHCGGAP